MPTVPPGGGKPPKKNSMPIDPKDPKEPIDPIEGDTEPKGDEENNESDE